MNNKDLNSISIVFQTTPDKSGIISKITAFFAKHKINIDQLEEHVDNNSFFMRVTIKDSSIFSEEKWQKLDAYFKALNITFKIHFEKYVSKLVLFCSKELHCLVDIIGQIENKELNASIDAVIANHPDAKHICNAFNIPFEYISEKNKSKKQYEDEMFKRLEGYSYECIGLAKYMQILSASFLKKVDVPIINIHHSFLPAFVGANPYRQAYNKGVKLIGATAHYVTETLDDGPIIAQEVTRYTFILNK